MEYCFISFNYKSYPTINEKVKLPPILLFFIPRISTIFFHHLLWLITNHTLYDIQSHSKYPNSFCNKHNKFFCTLFLNYTFKLLINTESLYSKPLNLLFYPYFYSSASSDSLSTSLSALFLLHCE